MHPARLADRFHALLATVDSKREREILALVSMACFADEAAAAKIAQMAHIRGSRNHTWAEAAFRFLKHGNIAPAARHTCEFQKEKLDLGMGLPIDGRGGIHVEGGYYPDFVNPAYRERLFALNIPGHRVFACRRHGGRLALIYVMACDKSVLLDEDLFNDDVPLYFTESSYFRSPVNVLNTLREIFQYVLAREQFPPLHLELCLAVPSQSCTLLNIEDFQREDPGQSHPDWRELTVLTRRACPQGYLIIDVAPFFGKETGVWYAYDSRMRELLALTAEIFALLPADRFYSRLNPGVLDTIAASIWP